MRKQQHTSARWRAPAVGAVSALALAGVLPAAAAAPTAAPAPVAGAGFEQGLAGWTVTGDAGAARAEPGGRSGNRLTHWSGGDYAVTTAQRVTGLAEGWWTVSGWVKSGGALDATTLGLTGCGIDDATTTAITEQDDRWVRLAVSAYVVGGGCTISFATDGPGGAWASLDDVELAPGRVVHAVRGGDLSGVAKNEAFGATYADADGTPGDPVEILADAGMNVGRLKVWVDPADGYNDTDDVVATAKRIEAAGMDLLVDFHYSDRWTDPGAQGTPAAWVGLTPEQQAVAVHDHTREVLDALAAEGITADMVQVGNEINPGMMWPNGQTWDVDPTDDVPGAQWDNLAMFLKAGASAVKEVDPDTQVVLHLTNINNGIGGLTWWYDEVTERGVPFDLVGLSYYGYWHSSLAALQEAVTTLSARYDKDVVVVETSYPWTLADHPTLAWENVIDLPSELVPGYPATPEGQAAHFRAVQDTVVSAPGGRGLGAVYWDPAWTAVEGDGWDPGDASSGNAWENQAVFDFEGRLLPTAAAELAADPEVPTAAEADLRAVVTGPASAKAGSTASYTLTVTNTGPGIARQVGAALGTTGLTGSKASPGGGTGTVVVGGRSVKGFNWTVPALAPGQSATFTVTGRVTATAGSSVDAIGGTRASNPDPAQGDNTSTTATRVTG